MKFSVGLVLLWITSNTLGANFRGLGDLAGGTFLSIATGVSLDGQVVVGYSASSNGTEAVRWSAGTGLLGLSDLAGGIFFSAAYGVSPEGTVIVGEGRSASGREAFRWTEAGGMVGLGDLPGGAFNSAAFAVSSNGSVIVGEGISSLSGTRHEAFRWTSAAGMQGLGDLPGGNFVSVAYAVSGDGSIIGGYSSSSNATAASSEAFRWTRETGMVPLGDFPGGNFNSVVYGISAYGNVLVGRGYSGATDLNTHEAFRWTTETGLVRLGFIPCNDWSIAHAASADGSVIVGDPESNRGDCAFIWDSQHGMRNLHEILVADYGLNLTGWQLSGAKGISGDGTVIVGFGTNPAGQTEGWIADLRPPRLAIRREATNVILSWETNALGFVLEESPFLGPASSWSTSSATVRISAEQFVVTNGIDGEHQFYRLSKP